MKYSHFPLCRHPRLPVHGAVSSPQSKQGQEIAGLYSERISPPLLAGGFESAGRVAGLLLGNFYPVVFHIVLLRIVTRHIGHAGNTNRRTGGNVRQRFGQNIAEIDRAGIAVRI